MADETGQVLPYVVDRVFGPPAPTASVDTALETAQTLIEDGWADLVEPIETHRKLVRFYWGDQVTGLSEEDMFAVRERCVSFCVESGLSVDQARQYVFRNEAQPLLEEGGE